MNGVPDRRFLVIALDGATFSVIRPLVARGELPAIGAMMNGGFSAPLLSTVPPITPPAWSSFATGAPPQEHGVFGFNYPDAGDYALHVTTASDQQRPALWHLLSRAGRRILLIDAPFTFPPGAIAGAAITGFPLPPDAVATYPADLGARLEADGMVCVPHPNDAPDPTTPDFLEWFDRFSGQRLQIFRHLSEREPWQFAMVGTMAIDWAQHALWKYLDPRFVFAGESEAAERRERLSATYRRVDGFVADLVDVAGGETTVVLVSDHGFGTTFHYDWIGEALAEAGLLSWRSGKRGVAGTLGTAALKAARSSPRLQRLGKRMLGDTAGARAWARRARAYSEIDWERTRVFPAGDYNLNLYVNSRSRFARGIVGDGADMEKVLEDARAALAAFQPPNHDVPLVRRIVSVGGGETVQPTRVPDLSLELNDLPPIESSTDVRQMAGICGFHTREGILIANSSEWLGNEVSETPEIGDLAPAILRHLGVRPGDVEVEQPSTTRDISADQEAEMLARLRQLGYLD